MKYLIRLILVLCLGVAVGFSRDLTIDGPSVTCRHLGGRTPAVVHLIPEPGVKYLIPREVLSGWEETCNLKISDYQIRIDGKGELATELFIKEQLKLPETAQVTTIRPLWVLPKTSRLRLVEGNGGLVVASAIDSVSAVIKLVGVGVQLKSPKIAGDVITADDIIPAETVEYTEFRKGLLSLDELPRVAKSSLMPKVLLKDDVRPAETLPAGSKISVHIISENIDLKVDGTLSEVATLGKPVRVLIPSTQRQVVGVYRGQGRVETLP